MASPHSESFYCIPATSLDVRERYWYAGVSLLSASLSLFGSAYLLQSSFRYLKSRPSKAKRLLSASPHIVFFLALSDVIACVGVIARSASLATINAPINSSNSTDVRFCNGSYPSYCHPYAVEYLYFGVPIESVLRFGYIATFMWTLFYAVDVFLKSKEIFINPGPYHAIAWTSAFVLAVSYVVVVFAGVGTPCAGKYRLIGSYFLMYLPMLAVMIVNPLLYASTAGRYEEKLKQTGKYSKEERQNLKSQKLMFLSYVVIFYFCWVASWANLIIALLTPFNDSVPKVPFGIWIANAITNPMQGFLNSLCYGRVQRSVKTNSSSRHGSTTSPIQSSEGKDNYASGQDQVEQAMETSGRRKEQNQHEKDPLLEKQTRL